jgi:hypothetical protein
LKKIKQEIRRLERAFEESPPEIYTLKCPFCNKEFSCELELEGKRDSISAVREAKEELNEKKTAHIREVHGEGENDSNETSEIRQKIEPVDSNASQMQDNTQTSQKSNENKTP